jgi:hypothetical protein
LGITVKRRRRVHMPWTARGVTVAVPGDDDDDEEDEGMLLEQRSPRRRDRRDGCFAARVAAALLLTAVGMRYDSGGALAGIQQLAAVQ